MEIVTASEKTSLDQLRKRIADLKLSEEFLQDKFLVRWLRARKGNLDAADAMIRKTAEWLKTCNFDSLAKKPYSKEWEDLFPWWLCGLDSDENPVICCPIGQWDLKTCVEKGHKEEFIEYVFKTLELAFRFCKKKSENKPWMGQAVVIADFKGYSMRQIFYEGIQMRLKFVRTSEDNFPEFARRFYCLNSPLAFRIMYSILKRVIDEKTMSKVIVMGHDSSEWRREMSKVVPLSQFPKMYGGEGDDLLKMGIHPDGSLFTKSNN